MASDKKGAIEQAATLAFHDESGFSLKPSVRRTWSPRGQTPILTHHFNWERLNAIGAITCRPDGSDADLLLQLYEQTIDECVVLAYLDALHTQIVGRVVLLWDGLGAHKSERVQTYLAQNRAWLTVERFPGYAPEINPMEYVWSAIKGEDVANFCPDTLKQLRVQVGRARRRLRRQPDELYDFLAASGLYPSRIEHPLTE